MFEWLRRLMFGSARKYKIGDRVYFKRYTKSAKHPEREVYIIDDVLVSPDRLMEWYRVRREHSNKVFTYMGGITDRDLEPAPPR